MDTFDTALNDYTQIALARADTIQPAPVVAQSSSVAPGSAGGFPKWAVWGGVGLGLLLLGVVIVKAVK